MWTLYTNFFLKDVDLFIYLLYWTRSWLMSLKNGSGIAVFQLTSSHQKNFRWCLLKINVASFTCLFKFIIDTKLSNPNFNFKLKFPSLFQVNMQVSKKVNILLISVMMTLSSEDHDKHDTNGNVVFPIENVLNISKEQGPNLTLCE